MQVPKMLAHSFRKHAKVTDVSTQLEETAKVTDVR